MTQIRATTRFCGATSLHFVTITSPLCRDPKLISNNMAAVLAMFDGLALVCAAPSLVDQGGGESFSAGVEVRRDPARPEM